MVECRGRNGWFKYNSNTVTVSEHTGECFVSINSTRHGKMPPIMITGKVDEVKRLIDSIQEALSKKMKPSSGESTIQEG